MDEDPEPAFPQPYHSPHTEQGADRVSGVWVQGGDESANQGGRYTAKEAREP